MAASCVGPSSGEPAPPPPPAGLAQIDPCTLLTPQELQTFGFQQPGQPETGISSEPGCFFSGRPFGGTFYKNQEKTVEAYAQQANWAKFERTEIDGRPAANGIDKSATQARICSTMFSAGGGVIIIDLTEMRDQGRDECAEGVKIAQAIAPRLPK